VQKAIDEEYDDDIIPSKTDKFKAIDNGHRMGVQFFFDNAKRKINKDFPNVFGEGRGRSGTGKKEFLQLDSTTSS
jgi:hypothetical protein